MYMKPIDFGAVGQKGGGGEEMNPFFAVTATEGLAVKA